MANILSDGTVIPSFLSTSSGGNDPRWSPTSEGEFALKIGTVFKIYYPDEEKNVRKNRIEYDIKVGERNGRGGFNVSIYKNCVCADFFGGIADSLEYTLRPSDDPTNPSALYQTGSKVLLLCLNGDSNAGVIIGGTRNIRRSKTVSSERGHFLEFEFNGVNVEINQDGELTATYKSKTDIQGTPQDEVSGGTYIKIDKTGSVEVHANDATWVKVDKPANDLLLNADNAIREIANVNLVANAPTIKIGGDDADQPLVLGTLFMALYNAMISKFNGHTHGGVSAGLASTGTPSAQAAKMTKAQLSDFVSTKKSYKKEE